MISDINSTLNKLDKWITNNKFLGYDPFDIWGGKLARLTLKYGSKSITKDNVNIFAKLLRGGIYLVDSLFPEGTRAIMGIKKEINPKAMAILMESYLNLYSLTGDDIYLKRTEIILDEIIELKNTKFGGFGWGYPFDWQSLSFIPKWTPSAVVTSFVAKSLFKYYYLTERKEILEVLKEINKFFLEGLNKHIMEDDTVCFCYTPLDTSHVLNANILVSRILFESSVILRDPELRKWGRKSLGYTLRNQENNGGFYYYGPEEGVLGKIDHYHNVYIYQSMEKIYNLTNNQEIKEAMDSWITFYLNELFEDSFPKYSTEEIFPIDAHTLSNAIIALSSFEISDKVMCALKRTLDFSINNFFSPKGYFYYRVEKWGKIKFTRKFPYLRWSQAWFHLALSTLLVSNGRRYFEKKEDSDDS